MSTTRTTPDADTVAERLLTECVAANECLSVALGLELGLFAALATHGPATSAQLADRAGIDPRYAREWLEQQTAAGYVTCADVRAAAEDRRFELPDGVRTALLDGTSDAYIGPLAHMVMGTAAVIRDVAEAYRTGGGVRYGDYGHEVRHGLGAMNGGIFDRSIPDWVGTMPDVVDRLQARTDPLVLDLGCGTGRSTLALARTFPRAQLRGVDLDPASVAEARAAAAAAGLADRVVFEVGDAATVAADRPADLVTIFEALHDMGDPVGALRAARGVLADDGVAYVVDERVADTFTDEPDIVERLQFGFSVLHCLPATMAEDPVIANGTVLRRPTLEAWAREAGFATATVLDVEDLFWRHYRLDGRGTA